MIPVVQFIFIYCMIFTCGVALNHVSFPLGFCESAKYVKYMKEVLPFQIDFQRDTYFGIISIEKKEQETYFCPLRCIISQKYGNFEITYNNDMAIFVSIMRVGIYYFCHLS